jgi:anaerobic selenocysteine-containing dehydrogenase
MPTQRRDFLKKASLLAAGSVAGTQLSTQAAAIAAPAKKQMGLQTYSLRYDLNKDLKGGLARLSRLG